MDESVRSKVNKDNCVDVNFMDVNEETSQMSSREEVATGQVERLLLALVLGFPGGSVIKNPPANAGGMSLIPGWGRSLEKEMATHSSILAWEIPWTEKPGGFQSIGSQE